LTFMDDRTRTRRDHVKYLTLIRAIALLHQYQRPIRSVEHQGAVVPYVDVTLDDIAVANRVAHQVLGRSLDELAPQTRRLLDGLDAMVAGACKAGQMERHEYRFSRKQVRDALGWSYDQVRVHLDRLVQLEYVLVHQGGRGQSFEYELLYDGQGRDGQPFLTGLIDVEALRGLSTTAGLGASGVGFGGSLGVHWAAFGPGVVDRPPAVSPAPEAAIHAFEASEAGNALLGEVGQIASYRTRAGSNGNGRTDDLAAGTH